MIRLVKGAYWDSEIKRAQVDGLDGFPVFTRKVHTDVSYLACARKLLAAPDAVYPQFATHNAQTLASVLVFAGPNFYRGQYEFQCLHGMGEPLYEEVVGRDKLDRPCRVYAPVGSHETLLAYLVRRLLENGANTSFVNRIADASVAIDDLVADPVAIAPRDPADRRAARKDRGAARPLCARSRELARARLLRRAASGQARQRARPRAPRRAWRAFPPGARERRAGRAGPEPRRSMATSSASRVTRALTRSPRRSTSATAPRPRLRRDPADRAGGDPAPRRRPARGARTIGSSASSCARPASPTPMRSRKCARRPTSCAITPHEAARTFVSRLPCPARPRRLHQSVELSARDLHRPDRRRARGGQFGDRQARRGDAAHRRRSRARCCTRPAFRPTRSSSCRARAKSARRWSPIRASRASSSPARRRSRA